MDYVKSIEEWANNSFGGMKFGNYFIIFNINLSIWTQKNIYTFDSHYVWRQITFCVAWNNAIVRLFFKRK